MVLWQHLQLGPAMSSSSHPGHPMAAAPGTSYWGWKQSWRDFPGECLSWRPPFTPSWKASTLKSPRIPLSGAMWPSSPMCTIIKSWCASWVRQRSQDLGQWPCISATLVLCCMTSSWRILRSSRIPGGNQREWCIENYFSFCDRLYRTFLPPPRDSRLSSTLFLLRFLPHLASQAQQI